MYTTDEELGSLLSMPVGNDRLEDLQTKSELNSRMAYTLNSQSALSNKGFSSVLYVNPELPVSTLFRSNTTVRGVSRLFSAETFLNEDWYTHALDQIATSLYFVDETEGRLCFAKKLQNSHYSGPPSGRRSRSTSLQCAGKPHSSDIFFSPRLLQTADLHFSAATAALLYQSDALPTCLMQPSSF